MTLLSTMRTILLFTISTSLLILHAVSQDTTIFGNKIKDQPFSKPNVYSMVKHPAKDDTVLATVDHGIIEINLIDLGHTAELCSTAHGYTDGALGQSRFNNPRGMASISDSTILIADKDNHRIRKLDWLVNERTVSTLLDQVLCSQLNSPTLVTADPRNKDKYVYVALLNGFTLLKWNIQKQRCDEINLNLKEIKLSEENSRTGWVFGMDASHYYQQIYIFLVYNEKMHLLKLSTKNNENSVHEIVSRDEDKQPNAFYTSMRDLGAVRPGFMKVVGDHIIASFRDQSLLYDFHLHEEALHSISLHPEEGSAYFYFDHPVWPKFMYVKKSRDKISQYSLNQCNVKRQTRPKFYSDSWIRFEGIDCYKTNPIQTHQISDTSIKEGASCFSFCKKECLKDESCVAFDCNSPNDETQYCHLHDCALASNKERADWTCYVMADVYYAPPLL